MASVPVTMPKSSVSMKSGKITKWHVKSGDKIEKGQLLVTIETDKAEVELEAPTSGIVTEMTTAESEQAPVGAVIATIEVSD